MNIDILDLCVQMYIRISQKLVGEVGYESVLEVLMFLVIVDKVLNVLILTLPLPLVSKLFLLFWTCSEQ